MCSEARGLRCCVEEHEYFSRFQDTTDVLSGHPDPVFPGLSPLWFLSVFLSEAAVEGEVGSGRRRCWGLFRGHDFWHASVNVVWAPWSRGLKGWLSVCMLRWATLKKKNGPGKKSVQVPRSTCQETFWGDPRTHALFFHFSKFPSTQRRVHSESRISLWSIRIKCGSKTRIARQPSFWSE